MCNTSRREFLRGAGYVGAVAALGGGARAQEHTAGDFYRIATEETFGMPHVYDETAKLIASNPADEVGLSLPPRDSGIVEKLMDLGAGRIADMAADSIDKQLLSLWSPGVQVFGPELGTGLAADTNNRIAEVVKKSPDRFAGLVTVAPQDPEAAALEIERGMSTLGLHGVLINSYTKGKFLDDRKFWAIFEAAEAHDAAIYIHPRKPAPKMYEPFSEYGMDGAIWGFHMDISTHAVRLILSGVFDHFPGLTIVLGHMGEGLPFWLNRLDVISARSDVGKIERKPSDYFLDNFVITTSAMFWDPILELSHAVLGPERILFGVDYPFAPNAAGVRWLDAAPLGDDDKRKIYADNARRVFHIA